MVIRAKVYSFNDARRHFYTSYAVALMTPAANLFLIRNCRFRGVVSERRIPQTPISQPDEKTFQAIS